MSTIETQVAGLRKNSRKKVDLSTAHVADGQTASSQSVYDLVGIPSHGYSTTNLEQYRRGIIAMNLIQLQDEAYDKGVLATENRDILIDRLERKFLQETSKFRVATGQKRDEPKEDSMRDQALRILARGR